MTQQGNFRDQSIASLASGSQSLSPQNGSRQFLLIQNTGTANIGVNLTGGTAAIGGAGTVTLVPPGTSEPSMIVLDRVVTQTEVTVVGTAGQPVTCLEL